MAIKATVFTEHGESRELYIRLNSMSSSNHGVNSTGLFRGFLSKDAFLENAKPFWEKGVAFIADVSLPLWEQAYSELKKEIEVSTEDV